MSYKVTILTIFPEMFPGPLGLSLAGRALKDGKWQLDVINIRDFGRTRHKNVDDTPMGGGNGMIMRPDVLADALDHALKTNNEAQIIYPSPRGKLYNQSVAREFSVKKNIIILCGRFEGIDERIIDEYNLQQINVGDYILSGGEIAAFTILDSIVRLLPGVLQNQQTLQDESFERYFDNGIYHGLLLEYPLYTKPNNWRGRKVPDVLLSGNHADIERWRIEESLKITQQHREDLLTIKKKEE